MAYKMKGSPAKLGGIQGTSGHRSALKLKAKSSPIKGDKKTIQGKEYHLGGHEGHHIETKPWGKTQKKASGVKQKSPVKSDHTFRARMESEFAKYTGTETYEEWMARVHPNVQTKEDIEKELSPKEGESSTEELRKKMEAIEVEKRKQEGNRKRKEGEGEKPEKCPAGYHRVGGKCVLTQAGKDYLENERKKKEHEERKKEKVVKLPVIEEKLSSTEEETKKKKIVLPRTHIA